MKLYGWRMFAMALAACVCAMTQSMAQKRIGGDGGGGGDGCYHATSTFSQTINTPGNMPWSGPCTYFSPTHPSTSHFDYLDFGKTATSDDQWQCIQEVHGSPDPGGEEPNLSPYVLEHYWVFPNLPPGPKYLVVEGHASPNANETGNFNFSYNLTGPSSLNSAIPGATIAYTPDIDARTSAYITNNPSTASYYILLIDSFRTQPGTQGDQQADQVHIDYLAICPFN